MSKKFPKFVYVKREADNDGSSYLVATEDYEGLAELNGDVKAALYELVETVTITAKAEVKRP